MRGKALSSQRDADLPGTKMNRFDRTIGLEQGPATIPRSADHGAIVARSDEEVMAAGQSFDQLRDQCVFAQLRERHCIGNARVCHARSTSCVELKIACMLNGTRIEPVTS